MPIYEYVCEDCGREEEYLLFHGEKEPKTCPHCGGYLHRKPSFGVGFVLKGAGFYVNDYKKKESSGEKGSSEDTGGSCPTCNL